MSKVLCNALNSKLCIRYQLLYGRKYMMYTLYVKHPDIAPVLL